MDQTQWWGYGFGFMWMIPLFFFVIFIFLRGAHQVAALMVIMQRIKIMHEKYWINVSQKVK